MPEEGPKHKRARKSPSLQEKYGQKDQVDNLPTDSQPDPTETLDVGHQQIMYCFLFQTNCVYMLENTSMFLIELFIANTSIIHKWFM